jgi:crossover junction endodeoxyribonuclease RuvC
VNAYDFLYPENGMTKIIGIDPGLAATGIGIVAGRSMAVDSYSYGSINTPKSSSLPIRLDQIYSNLMGILRDEKPDLMVVEDIFSLNKYPKSGIVLGKVAGVILLAGCQVGIPVVEIPVREAKKVLTGNGNATKTQLEAAVRHTLNVGKPIKPDHASDALGLALIGLFRHENPGFNERQCS